MQHRGSFSVVVITMLASSLGHTSPVPAVSELSRWLPAGARGSLESLESRTASLRSSLGRSALAVQVEALLGSAGATPSLPPADAAVLASALPAAVRNPIASLAAAVHQATQDIGALSARQVETAMDILLSDIARWNDNRSAPIRVPEPGGRTRFPAPARASSRPLPRAIEQAMTASPQALRQIAAAIDTYVPMLGSVAAVEVESDVVDGCDMLDLLPALCVGSEADNRYTANAELLIDLGGNDSYENAAGGAPFRVAGLPLYQPVSVNIDLSGDDTYVAPRLFTGIVSGFPAEIVGGQGAGLVSSIGIAIDESGDDTYLANVPKAPANQRTMPNAAIQGAGIGGYGLLVDRSGTDVYAATGADGVSDRVWITAQGAGSGGLCPYANESGVPLVQGCSTGALIDTGDGDDRYSIDVGTIDGANGTRLVSGQGAAYGLPSPLGLLFDDGGSDAFAASGGARRFDQDSYPFPAGSGSIPVARISAQGVGYGGTGLLLTGEDDTSYQVDVTGEGMAFAFADGQGATQGGAGVLEDRGGNDSYALRTTLTGSRDVTISDPCGCLSASHDVHAYLPTLESAASGQGFGWSAGLGALLDREGDDTYLAHGRSSLDVVLHDRTASPAAPASLDVTGYSAPMMFVQGMAWTRGGIGILGDSSGSDDYVLESLNAVTARATSSNEAGTPEVTASAAPTPWISGQGAVDIMDGEAKLGALIDLGGASDSFRATSTNDATAEPGVDNEFRNGWIRPSVQGVAGYEFDETSGGPGVSEGIFVALGDDPRIVSSPSRPTCPHPAPGRRGFGTWLDTCRPVTGENDPDTGGFDRTAATGLGGGYAPAAIGETPSLSFTSATPNSADEGEWIDVSTQLVDPRGAAIADQAIYFALQFRCHPLGGWLSKWATEARTGGDGVATGRVPLRLAKFGFFQGTTWRLIATFDGVPGRPGMHPKHAGRSIAIAGANTGAGICPAG